MIAVSFIKEKCFQLYNSIVREQATPEFIARGWAIGMFCGCFLPFGIQLVFSIPAAFLLRGSKVGATLGTLITNHFTIFVIYPLQCYAGALITGRNLSYETIKTAMTEVVQKQNFETLFGLGVDITIAFFTGGFLLAAVMTPITYFAIKRIINKYRKLQIGKKQST